MTSESNGKRTGYNDALLAIVQTPEFKQAEEQLHAHSAVIRQILSDKYVRKQVYFAVRTNTDLTEGRGSEYTLALCPCRATAIRVAKNKGVQGTDASVIPVQLEEVNGVLMCPLAYVPIKNSSSEDLKEQERLDRKELAINKARAAGLTDEDIKAMRGGE